MDILEEYKNNYEILSEFGEAVLSDLQNNVLKYDSLNIQFISGRLKEPTSLKFKVDSDSKYQSISDVTDIVGVRIVTTYFSEIAYIKSEIEKAFEIDEENTNQNKPSEPSEFGYSSYHIIIKGAKKEKLKSYHQKFRNFKAEIQIRTILQHAWAEISHKIDYKAKQKVESPQRRKLFRISALLELADQEFSVIREEIVKSQKDLVPRNLTKFKDQALEANSLLAFVIESDICNALDQSVANLTESALHYNSESIIDKNLSQVKKLGIKTLGELDNLMRNNSKEIIKAFKSQNKNWIEFKLAFPEKHGNSSSPRGISITYLYFHLVGKYD